MQLQKTKNWLLFGMISSVLFIGTIVSLLLLNIEPLQLQSAKTNITTSHDTVLSISVLLTFLVIVFGAIILVTFYFTWRKIKKNEVQYRLYKYNSFLLNHISDAIISTDAQFIIKDCNEGAIDILGLSDHELKGTNFKNIFSEESELFHFLQSSEETTKNWSGVLTVKKQKENVIHVNISASAIFDDHNKLLGFVFVLKDISSLLSSQQQLQHLNENLHQTINDKMAQMDNVLNRINDAFIAFDNDWNYVYVNKKAADLYGMTVEEILHKNIKEVTPDIESYSLYKELLMAKSTNQSVVVELKHPNTDQWFEDWIYPDEQGVSVYYREITERKKSESDLLETQHHLKRANKRFEMISKAVNEALWDWDMIHNTVWGNDKYYELIGMQTDEAMNFDIFSNRIHPDDLKVNMSSMEIAYKNREEVCVTEYRYRVDDEKWIHLLNRQITIYDQESGKPIRSLGSLMDITELKETQTKIIHEKDLSESLINTLPGVFYMFDSDYRMVRWNQNIMDITGFSHDEMKEMHPAAFVPEAQRIILSEKIENVFRIGYDNIEANLLTKDQRQIPYYFTGIRTVYEGKTCLMGVGIDVSEAVTSKEQLRQLAKHLQLIREEERSHMSREIHDELGQQLTGLKMNLAWLKKKTQENSKEVTDKMQDTLDLVDHTVKTVRRIASRLRPSMLDDLGLLPTMEWHSEEFEKRYQIKSVLHCNRSELHVSQEQATAIFRIYQEGLTNVAKHSGASLVQTIINVDENCIQISITDNGRGIDSHYQKDNLTLGLLGIEERVIMLGGSFEILSEIQNGTTLLVKIPSVR